MAPAVLFFRILRGVACPCGHFRVPFPDKGTQQDHHHRIAYPTGRLPTLVGRWQLSVGPCTVYAGSWAPDTLRGASTATSFNWHARVLGAPPMRPSPEACARAVVHMAGVVHMAPGPRWHGGRHAAGPLPLTTRMWVCGTGIAHQGGRRSNRREDNGASPIGVVPPSVAHLRLRFWIRTMFPAAKASVSVLRPSPSLS